MSVKQDPYLMTHHASSYRYTTVIRNRQYNQDPYLVTDHAAPTDIPQSLGAGGTCTG